MSRAFLAVMLAAGLFAACSPGPVRESGALLVQWPGESSRILELKRGQVLELRLRSNPTTGYRWFLASQTPDDRFVPAEGTPQYEADTPGLAGGGGTETWTLVPVKGWRGDSVLRFEYRRPWETGPAGETVEYRVRTGG